MGDKKILVSSKEAVKDIGTFDTVTETAGDGSVWKIVDVDEVKPGLTSIIYKVHARR